MKKFIAIILSALMLCTVLALCLSAEEATDDAVFTPDTSWYDAANVQQEYTLTTAEQLAGMSLLINPTETDATPVAFTGITIKLGADIVFNYGDASGWGDLFLIDENLFKSMINWADYTKRVSGFNGFEGTFDGQGHYISGLYSSDISTANGLGLFERANGATIKNLSLVNSKIEGNRYVGTLIGVAMGNVTVENVYIDAYVNGGGTETGGVIGTITNENSSVKLSNTVISGEIVGSNLVGGIAGNAGNKVCTIDCENVLVSAKINGKKIAGISANQFAQNIVKLNNFVIASEFVVKKGDGNRASNLIGHSSDSTKEIVDTYSNVYALDNGLNDNESSNVTCKNGGKATEMSADQLKVLTITGWTAIDNNYPMPTYAKGLYDIYMANKAELQALPASDTTDTTDESAVTTAENTDSDTTTTTTASDSSKTTTAAAGSTADTEKGKSGCGSVVLSGASVMLAAVAGVAISMKKRRD